VDIAIGEMVYRFTILDVVKEIGFKANTNEGWVAAKVELLRERPKLAASDASSPVYRYFNVWVGTSGYGSSSKIENRSITFRVPDGWLRDNNAESVKLMMLRKGAWKELKTEKIAAETYKAYAPEFSGFAAVGVLKMSAVVPPPVEATPAPTPALVERPVKKIAGFEMIMAMMALSAIYLFRRKIQ